MSKTEKKKFGLTTRIFISLILGAIAGVLLHYFVPSGQIRDDIIINGVFYVVGQGFIRLMQMLVAPLVFCSLVCGSMSIGDTKKLGQVGVKTMRSQLMKLAAEPGEDAQAQALDAVAAYTQTFNKMGFIETEERDEIYMALRGILDALPDNTLQKDALIEKFEQLRDF